MITDRTSADINNSSLLRKKIQAGQSLTETEKTAFERGACTITMLNRVEDKQAELKNILSGYAYRVNIINKTWSYNDIFEYDDCQRLLQNETKLKQAFYVYLSTPETPEYIYGYKEANAIEKILVDIETMISDMKGRFRKCGTFKCGEENNL